MSYYDTETPYDAMYDNGTLSEDEFEAIAYGKFRNSLNFVHTLKSAGYGEAEIESACITEYNNRLMMAEMSIND